MVNISDRTVSSVIGVPSPTSNTNDFGWGGPGPRRNSNNGDGSGSEPSTTIVLAGESSAFAYSTDGGTTWSTASYWGNAKYVYLNNGNFIAFNPGNGYIFTSADGVNWDLYGSMPFSGIMSITRSPSGRFFASGYLTNVIAYSDDGLSWSLSSVPFSFWGGIVASESRVLLVGSMGSVFVGWSLDSAYSDDNGLTWTYQTIYANTGNLALGYGDGVFVSLDSSGNGASVASSDGQSWGGAFIERGAWASIDFGNGVFVASRQIQWGPQIAVSSNQLQWQFVTLPDVENANWGPVRFKNGAFYLFSSNSNFFATSVDGLVWELVSNIPQGSWQDIDIRTV